MKNKPLAKKIIAGKYKGKTLLLPSKETTRSSKAIVLESFFNTLQFDIVDSVFVEVFSGSGSIGLEALSRGAKEIIFMEKDAQALKILKKNISAVDSSSCEVIGGDSFVNIAMVVKKLQSKGVDAYIYIDPPFSIREGMQDIYDKMIKMISSIPKEVAKMVIIEHMSTLKIPDNIAHFNIKKSKKFGKTTLTYLVA